MSARLVTPGAAVTLAPGATLNVQAAGSDSDHWTRQPPVAGQPNEEGDEGDGVSYSWSAPGGAFDVTNAAPARIGRRRKRMALIP